MTRYAAIIPGIILCLGVALRRPNQQNHACRPPGYRVSIPYSRDAAEPSNLTAASLSPRRRLDVQTDPKGRNHPDWHLFKFCPSCAGG